MPGPIDNFFARNGMPTKPKKKSLYDKVKPWIPVVLAIAAVILAAVMFIYTFDLPVLISK